jgi:hypothetical protein
MRATFDKWWLVPLGILVVSTLVAVGIFFRPSEASKTTADCSGASATDYACYQEHYRDLVGDSGVEAAFAELKDEHEENEFVKSNCHQMTHVIGRAAAELYGGISGAYVRGDNFCFAGYYHGAMEAVVAKIGADRILEEAGTICAERGEQGRYSFYHYNCVHGLGHGFMGVLDNELFESLYACDALADGWERDHCYGGVFMENIMTDESPDRPSKFLEAGRPLYPCTDVESKYKTRCYQVQAAYALRTQNRDFVKAFVLCGGTEADFRPACYEGLGREADGQSIKQGVATVAKPEFTGERCMLGEDHEARSNCVKGAVKHSISYYQSDEQAKALCESLSAGLRSACIKTAERFYGGF